MNIKNFQKKVFSVVCAILSIFTGFFVVDVKIYASNSINVFLCGTENSIGARENLSKQFYSLSKTKEDFEITVIGTQKASNVLKLTAENANLCVFCVDYADNQNELVDKCLDWLENERPQFHKIVFLLTGFKSIDNNILSEITKQASSYGRTFMLIEDIVYFDDSSQARELDLSTWLTNVCQQSTETFKLTEDMKQSIAEYEKAKEEMKQLLVEYDESESNELYEEHDSFSESDEDEIKFTSKNPNTTDFQFFFEPSPEFEGTIKLCNGETGKVIYDGINKSNPTNVATSPIAIDDNSLLDQNEKQQLENLQTKKDEELSKINKVMEEIDRIAHKNLDRNTEVTVPSFFRQVSLKSQTHIKNIESLEHNDFQFSEPGDKSETKSSKKVSPIVSNDVEISRIKKEEPRRTSKIQNVMATQTAATNDIQKPVLTNHDDFHTNLVEPQLQQPTGKSSKSNSAYKKLGLGALITIPIGIITAFAKKLYTKLKKSDINKQEITHKHEITIKLDLDTAKTSSLKI